MKRWIVRILGGLLAVIVLGLGTIYALSAQAIGARYPFREHPVTVTSDSASRVRGEHIARLSCFGCHGDSLQGQVLFDEPGIARLVAPNALAKLDSLTDAEFAGFLRSGVRKDGSSSFIMPPPGFYHISDTDVAALLAYLRSMPRPTTPALPANSYRLLGRLGVVMGEFKLVVAQLDTTVPRVGDDPAWSTTRQGEYLARMICVNCHGQKLTGDPATPSPSIVMAAGYTAEQFATLLRTGIPRDSAVSRLTMMADVAREELRYLSDEEISAIHAYLQSLPATGVK